MQKLITIACLALLAMSMLAQAAKEEKKAAASFQPGASVELLVSVDCPKGWVHNPMMPLKLSFAEKYLKTAPFTVKQASFSIQPEGHPTSLTIKVPIQLKGQLPDGELKIPAALEAFICTEDESMCIMASEEVSLRVSVRAKADKGAKDQALAKGQLPLKHRLAPPES